MKKLGLILMIPFLFLSTEECPDDPGTVEMVFVPEGKFVRGGCSGYSGTYVKCNPGNLGYNPSVGYDFETGESPVREITLDAFEIDKTEVTVAAYRECVDAGVCSLPDPWFPPYYEPDIDGFIHSYCNWEASTNTDDYPINCVDWYQARTYCEWVEKRLPTEAEWEKAARGGCEIDGDPNLCEVGIDDRKYPWGNQEPDCTLAKYGDGTISDCPGDGTAPVGSFPDGDSPYGALDMTGNVWEWVADLYDYYYYLPTYDSPDYSPSENPQGPDFVQGGDRVFRGSGWDSFRDSLRSSIRTNNSDNARFNHLGFRCARTAE